VGAVSPSDDARAQHRGFHFGSYGRVIAGTDLRGGKPESANVVAHGPRIVEPSYLELDFWYGLYTPKERFIRPVITIALDGTLFHDTGDFDAQPALRNLYLEAEVSPHIGAWVGSRMYRGDDIYLFDYWPLDDLNTVGGGVRYRGAVAGRNALEVAAHAGVNRLNNGFQLQEIDVPNPAQGATTVVQLNRQRMVLSGTATYLLDRGIEHPNLKLKLHGEVHALPSGTRERIDGTLEDLPSDTGYLIGAQVGAFGFAPRELGYRRHVNAFLRYAKGLSAFDELAPPTSFGADKKTTRANELLFGLSGNWDAAYGNVMVGALSRRFVDSDGSTDYDDGWEYALGVRPLAAVVPKEVFVGADLSYQARFPRGLNPTTQVAQDPGVFQLAPMIVYSPMGPSAYDRPQLRIVYRAARLNQAARDLFVPDDPRRAYSWTYFLGVQAEWWFNSTTYR
jgi:maltoporin